MNENDKNGLKINYWFLMAIFVAVFSSGAVAIFFSLKTNALANQKLAELAETKRPANLDLTIIADQTCKDCFDFNSILEQIKKENIKINSSQTIDRVSDEGKRLIEKFSIKKLPTFLVNGELEKNQIMVNFFSKAGDVINDTFVFRQVGGPYVETATGKIKGRANLVLLTDITCLECYDVTQHEIILKQFGMQPTTKILDIKSAEGRVLKNKYDIKMAPTFVLSGDINEYPDLKKAWPEVGMVAYDGAYVFTKGVPFMGVYKNLITNKIIAPNSASSTQ